MSRFSALLLFSLLFPSVAFAQAPVDPEAGARRVQALEQINRDVWEPFVRGVGAFDDATYLATRSRDFLMVQARPAGFFDRGFYAEDSAQAMRGLKEAGSRLQLEVRFDERISDGEYASERGIVRTILTDVAGKARTMYSRFHAILRKEDGHWRVLTEYRWTVGRDADAAAYEAARPQGDVEAFR